MSIAVRRERSLVNHDEFDVVRTTHHPFIYELDADALHSAKARLRDLHAKERTLARQKRREVRGKAEPRGGSFPGTAERPAHRKQVFATAVKRINGELRRRETAEAKAQTSDAARKALAMRREASFQHHPASGANPDEGMKVLPSRRRRTKVHPGKVGRVSQAGKAAQARRDAKNA